MALYLVEECLLLWPAEVPEAEIIFVNQHLTGPKGVKCDQRTRSLSVIGVTVMFTICRREETFVAAAAGVVTISISAEALAAIEASELAALGDAFLLRDVMDITAFPWACC